MNSDQSTFGKRRTLTSRDHEVIEDAYINQRECIFEPSGNRLVRVTGFGDLRRMVVKKNDGGRIELQRLLYDDARMN